MPPRQLALGNAKAGHTQFRKYIRWAFNCVRLLHARHQKKLDRDQASANLCRKLQSPDVDQGRLPLSRAGIESGLMFSRSQRSGSTGAHKWRNDDGSKLKKTSWLQDGPNTGIATPNMPDTQLEDPTRNANLKSVMPGSNEASVFFEN